MLDYTQPLVRRVGRREYSILTNHAQDCEVHLFQHCTAKDGIIKITSEMNANAVFDQEEHGEITTFVILVRDAVDIDFSCLCNYGEWARCMCSDAQNLQLQVELQLKLSVITMLQNTGSKYFNAKLQHYDTLHAVGTLKYCPRKVVCPAFRSPCDDVTCVISHVFGGDITAFALVSLKQRYFQHMKENNPGISDEKLVASFSVDRGYVCNSGDFLLPKEAFELALAEGQPLNLRHLGHYARSSSINDKSKFFMDTEMLY